MKDINRRAFIHQSAMVFLAAATLLGARTNAFAENRGKGKPNILFIMTDQQHARHDELRRQQMAKDSSPGCDGKGWYSLRESI